MLSTQTTRTDRGVFTPNRLFFFRVQVLMVPYLLSAKTFSRTQHAYAYSPEWIFKWLFRSLNFFPHWGHVKGFSPVCSLRWILRFPLNAKLFSYKGYLSSRISFQEDGIQHLFERNVIKFLVFVLLSFVCLFASVVVGNYTIFPQFSFEKCFFQWSDFWYWCLSSTSFISRFSSFVHLI